MLQTSFLAKKMYMYYFKVGMDKNVQVLTT